jgi:lipopolysaccharide transport system ATP-binding protein
MIPTPSASDFAIRVTDLSKQYRIDRKKMRTPLHTLLSPANAVRRIKNGRSPSEKRTFWALGNVTFDVARGERLAIIGKNGAGKSTLLKILSRIVHPTCGEARIRGRLTSLLEVGTGFNDELTGSQNIFMNASYHRLTREEIEQRFDEIVAFSGIDRCFLDMPVKNYSSGMKLRLAFSVAAHLDPDILLLDEVLAVGDMAFQEKCLNRVEDMMEHDRTVVLVSHNMQAVTRFTNRAIWLDEGRVVMDGQATEVATAYTEHMTRKVFVRRWTSENIANATAASCDLRDGAPERRPSRDADRAGPGASGFEPSSDRRDEPRGILGGRTSAEFASVCVINVDRQEMKSATVDQTIGIEFVYDVLRDGKVILPAASFYDPEDTLIFTAVYTDLEYMQAPKSKGRYRSVLWLPPHLFNTGSIYVTVSLTTPTSGELERHVVVPRALSFQIYEVPFGSVSARGPYREVGGLIRPLLKWSTHRLE